MKIADPESIKTGEQELINSIMKKLDSEIIESMAAKSISLGNLSFREGDMVIRGDKIVYKMDFQATIDISVMFDRDGNIILNKEEEVADIEDEETDVSYDEIHDNGPEDDEMDIVFQKNRDFWLQKSEEASEQPTITEDQDEGDELEEVLKRNRDYWQSQTETS